MKLFPVIVLSFCMIPVIIGKKDNTIVCNGKCDCDSPGVIKCDDQELATAAIDPVISSDKIKVLSMRSNRITHIRRQQIMMGKADQLIRLSLSNNLIDRIDDGAFDFMPSLQELDLSNNKLIDLSEATFTGLSNLINLELDHNLIQDLSNTSVFAVTPKLQYLSIDWTPIKHLDNQSLLGLDNLIELSIDHAELSYLPIGTFKSLIRLETLSLRHNRFKVVPFDELKLLPQLKHLDLSGNPIVTINSNSFRYNAHLRTLTFINMPELNYIEDCAFCNIHELRSLEIINCSKFNDIDPQAFGRDNMYFKGLETIDLVNNSLISLDEDMLPWQNVTGMIRLSGNPWRCDCEIIWMTNKNLKFDKLELPVCATPLRLRGKSIPDLNTFDAGVCIKARLSGRMRAARVFLIAAIILIIFGLVTTSWYLIRNKRQKGLKLRNLFYKPQMPKYAYRNLAMGEEIDQDPVVVTNDGASILPKRDPKSERDLASRLAEQ